MAKATLRYGSTGGDVKTLQQQLRNKGYNIAVDGIFGAKTLSAVKDLQKNYKISVDGIVGNDTWGKILPESAKVEQSPGYTYTPYTYNPYTKSTDLTEAENTAQGAASAYSSHVGNGYTYVDQETLDNYAKEFEERPDFSYDFNTDALYQQYKDKYIQQGKMAMADTIGQAAAMTGGYGNSYAVTAGSQAYQAHLDKLNDVIPELYQLAYNKDRDEVQHIKDMIAYHQGERDYGLGLYNDEASRLLADRDYYQGKADTLSADEYNKWYDGVTLGQTNHTNNENAKYSAWRDSVEDGYTERELAMKEEAWNLEKKAYEDALKRGGNGGNNPGGNDNTDKTKDDTPTVKPTSTKVTTKFINSHSTRDRYLQSGKSLKQWTAYIEGEIEKAEANLSDEELMYLIQYYGLS